MRLYGLKDCPAMREIVVGLSRMLEPRKVFEEHLAKAPQKWVFLECGEVYSYEGLLSRYGESRISQFGFSMRTVSFCGRNLEWGESLSPAFSLVKKIFSTSRHDLAIGESIFAIPL